MITKRHISGFAVLLMIVMQLLLAQHYTVHFNEDQHITASGKHAPADGDDHDKDGHDKICQVCLFSKSLSHLVLFALVVVFSLAYVASGATFTFQNFSLQNTTVVYPARGPPAFLS